MDGVRRGQYSLAGLMVVVTVGCVMLGVIRLVPWPDFGAVDPIVWGDVQS